MLAATRLARLWQRQGKRDEAGLEAALSRLKLVTREEFEIQQAVLQRTRQK